MNYGHLLVDDVFKTIGKVADDSNIQCYLIGGFVRDLLLQRPTTDIDVVCLGSGIELAEEVAKEFQLPDHAVAIFKNFGTAMLKVDDWDLEFVGARKESYQRDSRKPLVMEGSLEDDQNRRDFTINAMAVQLNQANWGLLLDAANDHKSLCAPCFSGLLQATSRMLKMNI